MWRATLSSLAAHKVRLALTTLAVVLGVAFVSGTLIYTDTGRASFTEVFGAIGANVDLSVRGVSQLDDLEGSAGDMGFGAAPPPVTDDVVERVAAVDGVAAVDPYLEGTAQVLDADGEPIGGQGVPVIGIDAPSVEALSPLELRAGRFPQADGEVALDAATATDHGFGPGDTVQVAADGPAQTYDVVGVVGFGDGMDNMAGASVTVFAPDTALALFSDDGGYAGADVLLTDGADVDAVRDAAAAAAGDEFEVVTGDQVAAEAAETVDQIMSTFSTGLLVFAGVSLLVGAFIINNTFAIVVAQRSRELALLRAVGASRRQVLGSVLFEALVVGALASAVGVGLGVGVALGLRELLTAFGVELPSRALVFAGRTVLAGLGVGVGVTVLSALAPALRALQVPPVAAMRTVATAPRPGRGRVRTTVGLLLVGGGTGGLGFGLFGDAGFGVVIGGALALLLGAALLARHVTRPLLGLLGRPVVRLGVHGALAQQNAMRSPQRTASTASALMIGLGLVTFALIFGASLRASFERSIDEQFASDLQVRSENFAPLHPELTDQVATLPEVDTVVDMRLGEVGIAGQVESVAGVTPAGLATAWRLDVRDGSLADFADGGLVVADDTAEELGIAAGDTLAVTFPRTGEHTLPVRAVVDNETASFYLDEQTFLEHMPDEGPLTLYVVLDDAVAPAAGAAAVEDAVADHPAVGVQDAEDLRQDMRDQVNQMLGLMSALLGLSILIALFGIANTLSLSVFERVREFGLLRAVGATQSQVRAVVRWESVLIAVLGAVFGVAVGALFGWMSVQALAESGLNVFAFPTVQVLLGVAAAAIAGMLAALVPARRAARVDVLRAVAAD